MAGTSEFTARVRLEPAVVFNAADLPVGNIATRAIANNLNHYQDSYGQVRMAWGARAGAGTAYWTTAATTEWVQLGTTGAFPIAVREDGSSYRVRISLYAEGLTGFFGVVLAPTDRAKGVLTAVQTAAGDPGGLYTDSVWLTGGGGAAPALIAGVSQGVKAFSDMVFLNAEEMYGFVTTRSGPVDIGGDETGSAACMVSLSIWAHGTASVYGATLTEVPG